MGVMAYLADVWICCRRKMISRRTGTSGRGLIRFRVFVCKIGMGIKNKTLGGQEIPSKIAKKGVPKFVFWGRQVGAFSVFGEGVYRNPVHKIGIFGLFFGKLTDLGVDVI